MKSATILISILAIAACGGKQPAPAQPSEPEPEPAAPAAEAPEPAAAEPEPPPPPPKKQATAELTPIKGAKLKAATVTFEQAEGEPVTVGSTGWFDGIKSGKYHLVVHAAAACGPNGTKAGKAGTAIEFFATAGMDALDVGKIDTVQLAGDTAIIGQTLVLHDDKNGKPGKALACGPIVAAE